MQHIRPWCTFSPSASQTPIHLQALVPDKVPVLVAQPNLEVGHKETKVQGLLYESVMPDVSVLE